MAKVHYRIETGKYACGVGNRFTSQDISSVGTAVGVTCQTCIQQIETGRIYPCLKCDKLRTKAEGGTTFTVCEDCWKDQS